MVHMILADDHCSSHMHSLQLYLNVIDQSRLYAAPSRGSKLSQQLAVGLDLLQDGSKDLLPILANSGNSINQYSEDDLHITDHFSSRVSHDCLIMQCPCVLSNCHGRLLLWLQRFNCRPSVCIVRTAAAQLHIHCTVRAAAAEQVYWQRPPAGISGRHVSLQQLVTDK